MYIANLAVYVHTTWLGSNQNDFFKKNNCFWDHTKTKLFLAIKNEKIVGRIAIFIDNKYENLPFAIKYRAFSNHIFKINIIHFYSFLIMN